MMPPKPPIIWTTPPRGSVLVLAPHPDDETLACGGAIALHAAQGDPVTVVIATDGAAGDPEGHYHRADYPVLRQAESRSAAEILGVTSIEFWGYPDGRLAGAADLTDRLADGLRRIQPTLLYHPSTLEIHADHWALAMAVDRARESHRSLVAAYAYEIWATVQPTHLLDITAVWELKRKAAEQYQSQLRYNDYLHKIAGLNAYRAFYLPSARYVEAFQAG
ncbi:MAG: PIG-L family deacetylase [Candidatus Methylomirabilis oxyfera]|nr:PIG-L family deacetylase [Candidatus Methylomirabilis oxyfera]